MGLRPLDVAHWLVVDDHRDALLADKQALMATAHEVVFAALPGSEAAAAAVGREIRRWLSGRVDLPAEQSDGHPLEVAARVVVEDLCLMERRDGAWRLTAASVCWPSRWSLAAKIGADLDGIHAPVPGYDDALAGPTARSFDRLRVDRPVWRLNWTLVDDPTLHQPTEPAGRTVTDPGRDLWWRVERQTLRRLDERPAILFTIHTTVTRLDELIDTYPDAAPVLRQALATMPPATLTYKGLDGSAPALASWLASTERRRASSG